MRAAASESGLASGSGSAVRSGAAARVAALDWPTLADGLEEVGCALTAPLVGPAECRRIAGRYDEAALFRSTIDMARYRFGAGQYRYFGYPLPDVVAELRAAFWPHLLPIARDWAARLGRRPHGPRSSPAGWTNATPPGRPSPPPSCCATAPATGTRCTGTCTGTWSSRCRRSSG